MPLQTARLILDVWQPSDWTAFRPIAQDPEVMRYITGGRPWTDEQIRGFVDKQIRAYAERGFCRWRLLDAASREFMGFCGVGYWLHALEIGWWLARPYWGRGFATEAAQCALRDVFERVGLEHVISVAMVGNTASRRVMEKLGMRWQREFESDGSALVQYEIQKSAFAAHACFDV
ncbi:MAG: GNAT family N-acetyltransferase [Ignavibacteriota bacterium]